MTCRVDSRSVPILPNDPSSYKDQEVDITASKSTRHVKVESLAYPVLLQRQSFTLLPPTIILQPCTNLHILLLKRLPCPQTYDSNEVPKMSSSTVSATTPTRHHFERRVDDVKPSKRYSAFPPSPSRSAMMPYTQVGNLSENFLWRTC